MAEKKQWGNVRRSGISGPERPYDPKKAAEARHAFEALFRDAPPPPGGAQPSPLGWDADSLKALKAVADRVKVGHDGQFSGDFNTPSAADAEAMAPPLRRMMDAFGRAQEVLAAFQIEMQFAGKAFAFTATPPEDKDKDKTGTIRMSAASYALIAPFLKEKSNVHGTGTGAPPRS